MLRYRQVAVAAADRDRETSLSIPPLLRPTRTGPAILRSLRARNSLGAPRLGIARGRCAIFMAATMRGAAATSTNVLRPLRRGTSLRCCEPPGRGADGRDRGRAVTLEEEFDADYQETGTFETSISRGARALRAVSRRSSNASVSASAGSGERSTTRLSPASRMIGNTNGSGAKRFR